ncbi:MAG TPA: 2-oxo acid dehydrogenase subunit E2 [Terriglobia bacterium]|nr:2-oxo acid dehydrogenase subunit E2 [Terriglobia bacterium]
MATEFRIPELGENIKSGDLVKILVKVGDSIEVDQPVIELETDKATVEVPSPVSGVIQQINVKEGERVNVGQLVLTVNGAGETAKPAEKASAEQGPGKDASFAKKETAKQEAAGSEDTRPLEAKQGEAPRMTSIQAQAHPVAAGATETSPARPSRAPVEPEADSETEGGVPVPAAPSVRRMARELGVDVRQVHGSGPGGRISAEDVALFAKSIITGVSGRLGMASPPLPDFSRWGAVERHKMSNIRRSTAEHLSRAWNSIPHVTQHDETDVTHLKELRKQFGSLAEACGGKLTVTSVALKVVASALRVFPQFAASVDPAANEVVYKKYCHIGVAVDTDRGLLVPVVRDVDRKNILQLSSELSKLAAKARDKKLALEEMEGGVFTITNLGGIGGTAFTPIVNLPEVAILGMSRASIKPSYRDGKFEPRLMLPLSLSYDHRLIDGADAARFLRWVAEALEQPFLLPLQG